jgi:hypothetical protein
MTRVRSVAGRSGAALAMLATVVTLASAACDTSSPPAPGVPSSEPLADGGALVHETILDLGPRAGRTVLAMSDVHGGYDRMVALLLAGGVVAARPASPPLLTWGAGGAVLLVLGDLIDKGPQGLEVIEALRALEESAARAGGKVVVLLGNHEAELFADPTNAKATSGDGLDDQLERVGVSPADFAAGRDPRGAWLRLRPFGAKLGDVFFAHAGDTHGATLAGLASELGAARAQSFADPRITGSGSILEARDWYGDPAVVAASARALGVARFVFGHDPNALGARGRIAVGQGGALARIDCGMSPVVNDSDGCLLRIADDGPSELAQEILASGAVRELWRRAR